MLMSKNIEGPEGPEGSLSLASKKKSENPGNEVEVFKEGAMKYFSQQFYRSDGQLLVKAFNKKN